MKWHYGRLCALLALSIVLEMPLCAAGYGTLLFGLLIVSVSYAAASAAGDTRVLRRIYLALVAPVIIIDLGIITMGAGDSLALAGAAFQTVLPELHRDRNPLACRAQRTTCRWTRFWEGFAFTC